MFERDWSYILNRKEKKEIMETEEVKVEKTVSIKVVIIIVIAFALIIAAISLSFYFKIMPLLNPRLFTPSDFANNFIETEILCKWKEKASDVEVKTLHGIKVTAWTNRRQETDSTPNTTASNRTVYEGCCAVSRDLFGWLIKYGYKIYVEEMKQSFVVECLMAKELKDGTPIKRTIDIYMDKSRLEEAKNFRILNATIQVTIPRQKEEKK